MRLSWLAGLAVVVVGSGCGSSPSVIIEQVGPDSGPPQQTPDGGPGTPDGSTPDANTNPGTPDGSAPDGNTNPGTPDGAPDDASTCASGIPCAPDAANPVCYVGATTCGATGPVCTTTPAALGTPCGTNLTCDGAGNCASDCVNGNACPLSGSAAACNTGSLACPTDGGVPQCIATPLARGTSCGGGNVCDGNGNCAAQCVAGQACSLTGTNAACNTGATVCSDAGVDSCAPSPNAAVNGTSCGTNLICLDGECTPCTAGVACVPSGVSNPSCYVGATTCGATGSTCTATPATTGTSCGTNLSCDGSGNCVNACVNGGACTLTGQAALCNIGSVVCATDGGASQCAAATPKAKGTSCGGSNTCDGSGNCVASCVANQPCTLSGANAPCNTGATACTGTVLSCVATSNAAVNGASCGSNMVCDDGQCSACTAGTNCTPAGACVESATSCTTGTSVCAATTTKLTNGTACTSGSTAGVCVNGACDTSCTTGGQACGPTNTCHTGVISCSSGAPQCIDTGNALGNGATCSLGDGGAGVCNSGTCNACAASVACTPANECDIGQTSCATGSSTCTDTNVAIVNGTACGSGGHCMSGVCQLPGTLTATAGNAQTAYIDQEEPTPIVVVLKDNSGNPIAGASVTVASPTGAAALPSSGTTNGAGQFTFSAVLGRAVQQYTWTVSATNAPNLQITGTATNPPAGTTFALVNINHSQGDTPNPAPGTQSGISYPWGFQVLADGTIYFADSGNCVVRELSPAGVLTVVAGTPGVCGAGGDNGFATAAQLNGPRGVAVDTTGGVLYIADYGNQRIRSVTLSNGIITTVAGGGSAPNPGYGDGNVGTSAQVEPYAIAFYGPTNTLAFTDYISGRIRYLNANTGIVNNLLAAPTFPPAQCGVGIVPIAYFPGDSAGGDVTSLTYDSTGNLWIGAFFAGSEVNAPFAPCSSYGGTPAVVRMSPSGTLTAFAGGSAGSSTDGTWAPNYLFSTPPYVAIDPAGNLYMSEPGSNKILWMDAGNGRILTFSGTGAAGYVGDYVAYGSGVEYSAQGQIALDPSGNMYIADYSNFAIREVFDVGRTVKLISSINIAGGNNASAVVDQAGAQIKAQLLDSGGDPLVGYTIQFAVADPGGGLYATSAVTDATGTAKVLDHAGLAVGTYHFTASFLDPYGDAVTNSPLTYVLNATAATAGDILTVVNIDHSQGSTPLLSTQPPYSANDATMAQISYPYGLAVATSGVIYIADYGNAAIHALGTHGDLTTVAGIPGSAGFSGDNGSALSAQLNGPRGLAIDNTMGILYIADYGNQRIRAVTLSTGIITTVAGGGTAPNPGYGDGNVATSGQVLPYSIAFGPNNVLAVSDYISGRIRQVDLSTDIITNVLATATFPPAQCGVGTVSLAYSQANSAGGDVTQVMYDSSGNLWISAFFAGAQINAPFAPCSAYGGTPAVVKMAAGGTTLTAVAGTATSWTCGSATCTGSTAFGSAALSGYEFAAPPFIALNNSGALYMSESARNYVSYIDGTGKVQLYGGDGSPNYLGDYAPMGASGVEFNNPQYITFLPTTNRFLVSDTNNYAVRMIWE